ncbi:MAG: tetratricopeptide repeat protein [Ardenticatenaceae bacterium]|nr:tetratricopeptide repeat protein [Ardenticatenaceae bacterium]HBY98723.1 hypothetical protein [Chloroflexota bacterium]
MHVLVGRRPEQRLLSALLILGLMVAARVALARTQAFASQPTALAPAPVQLTTEDTITKLQDRIRSHPEDSAAYAQLGLALFQRIRETADASLYIPAETALTEALNRDPQQLDALIGQGMLALSRHRFAEGLQWGERARALNPYRAQTYGIIADAQIELGRYPEAVATLQQMVNLRPDLSSYSRISYIRELHGDTAGAIAAMKQAVAAGNPAAEGTLWTQVQLGHLYFNSGDWQRAEASYQQALQVRPDYVYALAGIARVRAAQGRYEEAIGAYQKIVTLLPLPAFVIVLGDLYQATGQPAEARNQYDLVRAIEQLNASAGVDVDLELALFDADHGADPVQVLKRARAAYSRRPSIFAADVLAWALYRHGDYPEAWRYSQEARRLGTRDATLHYHAGMIAYALGDRESAAGHLRQALAINPGFSMRYAPWARTLLMRLEQ